MSYVQIEIGGKLRGLKFNQGALITFKEFVSENDIAATQAYALVYAGLTANAHAKREELTKEVNGKEEPVSYEDVCDWVDNITEADIIKINDAWQSSQVFITKIKPVIDNDEKKNHLPNPNTEPIATE